MSLTFSDCRYRYHHYSSYFSAFGKLAYMNRAPCFLPYRLLVSCKPHHLVLIVYSKVSQSVGHGRIFDGSRPGNTEIEYIWRVEPFDENYQQISSAFALIIANVVSLKVVLISAPCVCSGCRNGELLHFYRGWVADLVFTHSHATLTSRIVLINLSKHVKTSCGFVNIARKAQIARRKVFFSA